MDWQYEDDRIYCNDEQGELMAEATFFLKQNGEIDIDHTYVNAALRGQGIAEKMMEAVAEHLKKKGLKTTATCPYANVWLKRHGQQYGAIISQELKDEHAACTQDKGR